MKASWTVLLWVGAAIVAFPYIWMILTALKTEPEALSYPPTLCPSQPSLNSFCEVNQQLPLTLLFANSLIVALAVALSQLLTCSLSAYALAILNWRWRESIFLLILATMMIPYQVTLIPNFTLFNRLGWVDTLWPLIVPYALGTPFGVFLLRQHFLTIPREQIDAARLDGASEFAIYRRIVLPAGRPALAALFVLAFMGSWNNFIGPLIYLNSPERFTLPRGLADLASWGAAHVTGLMAAAAVTTLPVILLFLVMQRYVVEGIALGGTKG